jgi:tetratricopeptide (TPR) repeat protein
MPETHPLPYKAFLSYSHADAKTAVWLHKRLEAFPLRGLTGRVTRLGTVPKQLRPIFRDREDFSAGHSLSEQTIAALDGSAGLIVLCSPASVQSPYVNEEVRLFKSRHPGRPLIPLIADGTPGGDARECFPPALRFELDAAGAVTDRPSQVLGADLREAGDGRELALAKVVAALIGVPSDEVFRRAERERRRQARNRNAVALVILLLAAGGSYFTFRSYRQGGVLIDTAAACARYLPNGKALAGPQNALEQCISALQIMQRGAASDPRDGEILKLIDQGKKDEAERLQVEAAQDAETAGIARTKEAAERYRGIAATAGLADPRKAREYYAKAAKLDPENISGMVWHGDMERDGGNLAEAERAYNAVLISGVKGKDDSGLYWAGLGLGDIRVARGNLPEALKAYQGASAEAERLAKANLNNSGWNSGWQRDLSVSYNKVGDVLVAQGNLPEALKSYRDGLAIADRLAKADPNNAGWQRDLSVSYDRVGDVLVAQGNLSEALKSYRDSLTIRDRLAKADPNNAQWQRDLSVSYDRAGDVLVTQGNLPEALKSYRDSLAIADRLAKADPNNAQWQRDLSVSYNEVGDVLVAQGNLPEALKSYRDSLAIRDRLAKADSNNAGWQRDLSVSYNRTGDVLVAQGNLPEALKSYRDSLAIADRLAKADPNNAQWQRDLSVSYDRAGDVLVAQGNLSEALKSYRDSLAIRDRLARADPNSALWQRDLSVSYNKAGDVLVAQGNLPEALKSFGDSLAIADRLAKADPNNAQWQRDLSIPHDRVGDVLVAQGNLPEALKSYRDSLAIRDRLARADPGNAEWQRDLAVSNERLGDMLNREGNTAEAIAAFERALRIYEELVARLSDPQARVNSVVPLWRLGELKGKAGQAELRRAHGILTELREAGRLDARRITWIAQIEAQIAALDK